MTQKQVYNIDNVTPTNKKHKSSFNRPITPLRGLDRVPGLLLFTVDLYYGETLTLCYTQHRHVIEGDSDSFT